MRERVRERESWESERGVGGRKRVEEKVQRNEEK